MMNTTLFWDLTPYTVVADRRFGGTYYSSPQGRTVSKQVTSKKQVQLPCLAYLTLKMGRSSSETSVNVYYRIIRGHILKDSTVFLMIGTTRHVFRVRASIGVTFFASPRRLDRFLRPTQPPIQRVPGALSPGVNRPGREADHSPPIIAEVRSTWVYTSISPHASSCRSA
jgi:hypothetical protein